MRLKSLEILGFKSFADPFRIDFRRGISAIVGPNGCGKSNVADAIRWVLGTQSPRQLRTEKMESVIFSGSTRRKQVGMAEVTLTFDNSDRALSLDYDEVSVSRRLFRSGESEYSINGSRCRLMDITDLVVDRGLGSTGYWILESKMVGKILSSRPEDRRFLFDEAAGIVKYKIQRHRAELKLDSAASDLERLADIISEVETNCSGLKRQVSAYRKHERVSSSIKALREAAALIESNEIRSRMKTCAAELDETGAIVGRETAALAAKSALLAEARTEFSRVQGRLDEAHAACAALDSKLASMDRESAVTVEKIDSASSRISENDARSARERERAELYRRDIETLGEEKTAQTPVVFELEAEHRRIAVEIDETRKKLEEARAKADEIRCERASIESMLTELQNDYMEEVRREEARTRRFEWLERSVKDTFGKIENLEGELDGLRKDRIELLRGKEELSEQVAALEETLHKLLRDSQAAMQEKAAFEKETAVLEDHLSQAEEALERSSSPESISSVIKPLPGLGKALGAFLHGFDTAVPANETDLGEGGQGALFFQFPGKGEPVLPEGARTLDDCVADPVAGGAIEAVLRRGVLAPDRETALEWLSMGCPVPVVTPKGDLFRPEGFLRLGVAAETAGSLELRQIIQEMENELEGRKKTHSLLVDRLESFESEILKTRKELSSARENSAALESRSAAVDSRISASSSALETLKRELNEAETELSELDCAVAGEAKTDFTGKMDRLKLSRDEMAKAMEEASGEIKGFEGLLSELLRKSDGTEFTLREKRNREKEIEDRISMLESERDRIEELLEDLSKANSESSKTIRSMEARLIELEKQSETVKRERGEAEDSRNAFAVERNGLMESTALLEREVQQIRDRLGRAKSLLIEQEARASSLGEKLQRLEEGCTAEDNPYLDLSSEELTARLEEETEKLQRIGPVNMLAVREYEEASGRLQYLTEQKNDLQEARASLSRAIEEINEEAAGRFRETFGKVRENFKEMFSKLFGGGEGDIFSIEGEDPLEGGIEIMAQPLGKKLKNVIALSEGEKAMTAVALLFSLYLVKPSPFCVLDELDAPFDDSNIDKFISILREFSSDTQFIVITHNKRTMEGSDVLYGITMAEEGVSSITSVSMEEMVKSI